ncbi:Cell-division control histidine kinase PdhS [Devosia equisanguinis]|uniref:histidine kinase n=2 Tax=Devosia equisanguinis TaxID=2490941 RepID=A0A3S4GKT4_9HYPH|nr:Cell-division control histidine kinase PdhS [Devosia equisanguinis]
MDDQWNTSPSARRVLQHADDARPAWLWSQDGQRLLWSNAAAGLYLAKLKKHGLKRLPLAVPIKGQVQRIIRLGSSGRTSLARIQFLAGDKPVSGTCATTPLLWEHDESALLIVHVDPIAQQIIEAAQSDQPSAADEPPRAMLVDEGETEVEQDIAATAEPRQDGDEAEAGEPVQAMDGTPIGADHSYAHELQSWQETDAETVYEIAAPESAVPESHDELAKPTPAEADSGPEPEAAAESHSEEDARGEDAETEATLADVSQRLSSLVDRLAAHDTLYTPLGEDDDLPPIAPVEEPGSTDESEAKEGDDLAAAESEGPLYRVIGRGFTPLEATEQDGAEDEFAHWAEEPDATAPEAKPADAEQQLDTALAEIGATDPSDAEAMERVSRYNFDELSRVLNERVGDRGQNRGQGQDGETALAPLTSVGPQSAGSLVNLGGETLVLNRLPLGILVFRDQQVLFANRAITEMTGYDTVEQLRSAGLAAVFPATGADGQGAGPVNHLVQRDGTLVPVTARLQSISWQGRPALMLSASATEVRTGHEDAVRAFAQAFAEIRGDGFIEANRNGTISAANGVAISLLGSSTVVGTRLSNLVGEADIGELQAFLERPARFAETARPCLSLRGQDDKTDILLFAVGQAGILSGYFGFVRAREADLPAPAIAHEADPALLARISRGVRRPLNTIVGFSDLIRTEAFGALNNERYSEYAKDISRAGQEIAALVDELDDYARLRDGRYLPQRASLELTSLLESCVLRIREQANVSRVIVRNAISESLPRVTADRASLAQAVLNLLASAIDQTPPGGAVVISAQEMDDKGIAIHVRDSSITAMDMADRFVVFRDGVGKDGQALTPIRSSVGLALTRSLLAVNAVSLAVDPAGPEGLLFSLRIPADLVERRDQAVPQQ